MLFGEMLSRERREGREEGREEGRSEGQDNILSLITAMTKDVRASDVPRLSEDPDFLNAMLEAYHIEV